MNTAVLFRKHLALVLGEPKGDFTLSYGSNNTNHHTYNQGSKQFPECDGKVFEVR
jgi:hypothetical protein